MSVPLGPEAAYPDANSTGRWHSNATGDWNCDATESTLPVLVRNPLKTLATGLTDATIRFGPRVVFAAAPWAAMRAELTLR